MLGNLIHEYLVGKGNIILIVQSEISLKVIGATKFEGCVSLFRSLNKQKLKYIHYICSCCLLDLVVDQSTN